uniref:FTP domain-containing protein n=1 Tax=Macrostomum lignano TaxID=282301 RepID=A0A1I8F2M3_9PLAT
MFFVASLPVALLLLQCFAGCSADSSGWPSEDDSTLSAHGHTRTVIISDQGSSVPVPETDIIQQETVWLNGGDETASHEVSHKYHGPVQELKLNICSQSSTARAIDGNNNQNYRKHSCTHTNAGRNWWQARLTSRAHIRRIQIFNRQDCCPNRLRSFYITVDGHKCAEYHSSKAFSVKTFNCDRVGELVRIDSKIIGYFTLCEVRVFGDPVSLRSKSPGE